MTLVEALINQGYSKKEAEEIKLDMHSRFMEGENPEELLEEYSLEPDYILEIL